MVKARLVATVVIGAAIVIGGVAGARRLHKLSPKDPIGRGAFRAEPSSPPCTADDESLCFIALGDTGKDTTQRTLVVEAMATSARIDAVSFFVLLGDNFYPTGVDAVDSPRFQEDFEDAFAASDFPVPFYVALGNHDHLGSAEAQVAYTAGSDRWSMPNRYYRVSKEAPDGSTVDIIVLDTVPIVKGDATSQIQLRWLGRILVESTADWRILIGHHPVESGGVHGGSAPLKRRLASLLREGEVDLYLSGHDHDLQVLRLPGHGLAVVSGSSTLARAAGKIESTLYSESAPGFTRVRVNRDHLCVSMITLEGLRYERHIHHREKTLGDIR